MVAIVIPYKGKNWTIPESRAFEVGEAVEEVVTLGEISSWGDRPRFFRISRAVGVMLRKAGCKDTDEEIHREMMDTIAKFASSAGGAEEAKTLFAISAIASLQAVLMQALPEPSGDEDDSAGKVMAAS